MVVTLPAPPDSEEKTVTTATAAIHALQSHNSTVAALTAAPDSEDKTAELGTSATCSGISLFAT
jgi:hypothetical protein